MKSKIIFLAGFMGSGKSTVGPILANTLGWDFYDLDKVIEEKIGMKVSEIFESRGEKYFREIEKVTLNEIIEKEKVIIALGGGTIVDEDNLKQIKNSGILIYLKVSPEVVYERIRFKRDRPILTKNGTLQMDKDEFINKINSLMEKRRKYYEQYDAMIDTDNITIGVTVDKIARIIISKK